MAAVLAALVASVIASLGLTGRAERSAQRAIRQRLGKVEQVQVRIDRGHRSPFSRTVPEIEVVVKGFKLNEESPGVLRIGGGEKVAGKIGKIVIRAEDFEVEGLRVERMEATIRSVRYDLLKALWKRRLRLTGMGESTIGVRLAGPALERYLTPRVTALDDFQIRLLHGRVEVKGKGRALLPVPVRLIAGLQVKNRDEIHLVDPRVRVSGLPVPGFLVSRVMRQVNPIVDLSRAEDQVFGLEIERLRIAPSGVSAQGRIGAARPFGRS